MSESNVTTLKRCRVCQIEKPLDAFCKHARTKDGLNNWCRVCAGASAKKYQLRPESKIKHRHEQREYRKTEQHQSTYRRYLARQDVMESRRVKDRARYRRNPDHVKARVFVKQKIEQGVMPPPSAMPCEDCGVAAQEYHHESYERDYWLDVIPLCCECHEKRHHLP